MRAQNVIGLLLPKRSEHTKTAIWALSAALIFASWTPSAEANEAPTADPQTLNVRPAVQLNITLTGSDPDSDPIVFIVTSLPTDGTVTAGGVPIQESQLPKTLTGNSVVYSSTADASGTFTMQFKVGDGSLESSAATITINVNSPPADSADVLSTEPDTDGKFSFPATDPDEDSLTYNITSLPGHGMIKFGSTVIADTDLPYETTSNDFTYSPDPSFHGDDSFAFTASDGIETTGTITAQIQVNTVPVPGDLDISVPPDGSVTISLTSTDADKDPVQYTIVSLPVNGTLSVDSTPIESADLPMVLAADVSTVEYVVNPTYRGGDSFHYRAKDGYSESDRAVVTIVVNSKPVAEGKSVGVDESGETSGVLVATDADGDTLTVRVTVLPTKGTLKIDGTTASKTTTEYELPSTGLPFTYAADEEATGQDSVTWVANDGRDDSDEAVVTIALPGYEEPQPEPDPEPDDGGEGDGTGEDPPPDDTGDGTDGEGSSEDDGEDVLSDEPDNPPPASSCSPFGVVDALFMTLGLFCVPGTGFFRRKPPTRTM